MLSKEFRVCGESSKHYTLFLYLYIQKKNKNKKTNKKNPQIEVWLKWSCNKYITIDNLQNWAWFHVQQPTLNTIIILQMVWEHKRYTQCSRLYHLRWARATTRHQTPQMKLRRAVYCSPTSAVGKQYCMIMKSSPRA